MTAAQAIPALIIHLVVPCLGLLGFLRLRKRMKRDNITNPPTTELFIIFLTYGGLLLVALTTLFWQWSGMASLGTLYLIFGAPIAMGSIAARNRHQQSISKYHYWTYLLGLLYFVIAPVTFGLLLFVSKTI